MPIALLRILFPVGGRFNPELSVVAAESGEIFHCSLCMLSELFITAAISSAKNIDPKRCQSLSNMFSTD